MPLLTKTYRIAITLEFHAPWMIMLVSRFRLRQYANPITHPSAKSCGKSFGVAWHAANVSDDSTTAPVIGMCLVNDARRKPRNTTSSKIGAPTPVKSSRLTKTPVSMLSTRFATASTVPAPPAASKGNKLTKRADMLTAAGAEMIPKMLQATQPFGGEKGSLKLTMR